MKLKFRKLMLLLVMIVLINPTFVYADETIEEDENEIDMNIPNITPIGDPLSEENEDIELTDESEINVNRVDRIIQTPASVTGDRFQGSGTVVDFSTTGGRAFYTIQAQDHSIFYLIIDLEKTENNVYFLSEINAEELVLTPASTDKLTSQTQPIEPVNESSQNNSRENGDSFFYMIVVVMSGFLLVFGYHKKVKKNNPSATFMDSFKSNKKHQKDSIEDENEDEEDGIDYDE